MLLISPGYPHCGGNLSALTNLVKENVVGRLDVVNIAAYPEVAQQLGVRSVPWLRLGPFELIGARSETELRGWAERVQDRDGLGEFFREQLDQGALAEVIGQVRRDPDLLMGFVPLLADSETGVSIRIGIGAVLEDLADTDFAARLVPELGELSGGDDVRTRQDASHYLALTGSVAARPFLQARLKDDDTEVRDIAAEGLQELPELSD
jgi:thioredoxin-like negative regulator of GroEL